MMATLTSNDPRPLSNFTVRGLAVIVATVVAMAMPPAFAERLSPQAMTMRPSLTGTLAGNPRLSPDGRFVAWLGAAHDDPAATVLWLMSTKGGPPHVVVDGRKLGRSGGVLSVAEIKTLERHYATSAAAFDYRWADDGKSIVLTSAGDVYRLDLDGRLQRLTTTEADETDAQFPAGGRYASYVRGRDLVVRSFADGHERRVADDASDTVFYGSAEFVAQEEMRRFTGQWWSPDGAYLAYTRVDERAVRIIPRVLIDVAHTSVAEERYPLTGTPNAEIRLFVQPAAGGASVEIDLGPTRDIYLANAVWSVDGRTLYVMRQSRDQKRLDLLAADPLTGKSRVLVTQTSSTWVDLERDFRPLTDGSFLLGKVSDGWRHLFLYGAGGAVIREVTKGPWRITNNSVSAPENLQPLVGVDERRGLVYFMASIDTPLESQLYETSYRHPDIPHRVTSGRGWWQPYMPTRTAGVFTGTYSDPTTPPQTGLYTLTGKRIAWLSENRLDATHPYFPYRAGRPHYEYGSLTAADGAALYYLIAKPAAFDPAKRYPAIVRVYGGPNVQSVRHDWRGPADQLLAEAGYVVFQLDNRGSTNRNEAFEHALAGRLSSVNVDDQLAGVRFLQSLPFIDPDRIGMMGWSFGGYMTVRMLTEPGSGVRAGAAGGTPSDFALYDTHYTERFLGTPETNPDGYRAGALLPRAGNLQGDLLLMHGLSDDNVVIANFTALVSALQAKGKLFETGVYPGLGHVPKGPHIWEAQLDFFARRLAPRTTTP